MDPSQKVLLYLEMTRQNPDSGLDETAAALVRKGLSSHDAEALIAFVPMSFGYVLLSSRGVTLSDSFELLEPATGARHRRQLGDQPIFRAAVEKAEQMFEDTATSAEAYEIARQSAEFDAANRLCLAGAELEKIILTEALLTRLPIDSL